MTQLPSDQHITYQLQYRKCGKLSCRTCRLGPGHGPYWYAYWRDGSHIRSAYIGKDPPTEGLAPESTAEIVSGDAIEEPHLGDGTPRA